jgi:hypothetical protein
MGRTIPSFRIALAMKKKKNGKSHFAMPWTDQIGRRSLMRKRYRLLIIIIRWSSD